MEILAHRGMWKCENEKNTWDSFERAFRNGFGIETDVRDYHGELVISHDLATERSMNLQELLGLYKSAGDGRRLALNVKADGLQAKLKQYLDDYGINNYFMFDMSVPEMVVYKKYGFHYYSRQSDVETQCVLYDDACGVWMDSFYDFMWDKQDFICSHIEKNKRVCIVSPELHGREYTEEWHQIKTLMEEQNISVELCTDRPTEAKEFFDEKN